MEPSEPPFLSFYKKLFDNHLINRPSSKCTENIVALPEANECEDEHELPLIDLSRLNEDGFRSEECKREMAEAAQEWGFFQVVNHGVSSEVLNKMSCEQVKAFKKPFQEKVNGIPEFDFLAGNYRWGTPSATCLRQLTWSEAFHVPLTDVSTMGGVTSFSTTMKQYAKTVSNLAEKVAEILGEKLGQKPGFFKENCVPTTCYIRMSRYPFCPISPQVFGLVPHTDSDFLTILHQDHVGGLELLRNGKWIPVNPKQGTLIVMIGDLFQASSPPLPPPPPPPPPPPVVLTEPVSEPVSYSPNRLNMRRSAMTNSLVRIGTVEGGDLVKRALAALIRPSSHQQRRRAAFEPRPSRLSVMSKADDL